MFRNIYHVYEETKKKKKKKKKKKRETKNPKYPDHEIEVVIEETGKGWQDIKLMVSLPIRLRASPVLHRDQCLGWHRWTG